MFDRLKDYVNNNNCEVNISDKGIYIINYENILAFDDNNIIIKLNNKNIVMKGKNLVISKLLNSEILITGEFKTIEIR